MSLSLYNKSDKEKEKKIELSPIECIYKFTFIHPLFHSNFHRLCENVLCKSSPFTFAQRHFMGIMAATRHHCDQLVMYHQTMFLRYNGDPEWLHGLCYADHRFQLLDEMNRYLAHQPWLVSADLIQSLITRGSPDPRNTFTLNELVHAAILLSHVHNLCTFIRSIGLDLHEDRPKYEYLSDDNDDEIFDKENDDFEGSSTTGVELIVKNMRGIETNNSTNNSNFSSFDCSGNESPESVSEEEDADSLGKFSKNPHFGYTDFKKRPERGIKDFKIHEFTWDHSFNVIHEFAPDSAEILDNMFKQIQKLTYRFMGSYESIDTTNYRLAVWNYIQLLFGIKHDDYNYVNTNILLDRSTKTFIKNAACFPHRLTTEYENVMTGFKDSEKIHVVIIVLSARMQSQMLHFGRALCNYNSRTMAKKGYRRPLD